MRRSRRLRKTRVISLSMVLLSAILFGASLWSASWVERGLPVRNWLQEGVVIPPGSVRWTWGVSGGLDSRPEAWHFEITLKANQTVVARLLWKLNESVLFEKAGSQLSEVAEINFPGNPGQSWRWDWQLQNPERTFALVENFTVNHFSLVRHGIALANSLQTASILTILAAAAFEYTAFRSSHRVTTSLVTSSD